MIIVMVNIKNENNNNKSVPPKFNCVISDSGKITKFTDLVITYPSFVYYSFIKKFIPDWHGWRSCFVEFEHGDKYVGLYVPRERCEKFDDNIKNFLLKNSTLRITGVRRVDPSVSSDYYLRLVVIQSLDLPEEFSWEGFLKEFKETVGIKV